MKALILKGGEGAVPWRQVRAAGGTRTPGSVALSDDGQHWALINLSPSVADQLTTDARLLEHGGLALPAARAVILTDAQVDHVTGLLSLRDGPPIHLYVTPAVYEELSHSLPVLPLLQHYCGVHWHVIPVAGECTCADFLVDGVPGLEFTAVATQAPLPRHAMAPGGRVVGDTIAVAVRDRASGQRLFCAPGLQGAGANAMDWMQQADCVLIGETFPDQGPDLPLFKDEEGEADETPVEGTPRSTRHERAGRSHASESIRVLAGVQALRKVLLRGSSDADGGAPDVSSAPWLAEQGIEVAADRMQIDL